MTEDVRGSVGASPFTPGRLGPVTLRNRIIKSATFEGLTPDGLVTDDLIEHHRKYARGGVGMTTVAFFAVSPEARIFDGCVVVSDEIVPGLRRLTQAVHDEGAAVSVQLGFAGPPSYIRPALGPSRLFQAHMARFTTPATESQLEGIIDDFGRSAALMADAGVDCIEVHLGHNYLVSSFMSPKLNKRGDRWGGSLEKRLRFPREIVRRVRKTVGNRAAITAKFNMTDGVPGGLWLEESIPMARMLQDDGALDALLLTGGSSLENFLYIFRGEVPWAEQRASLGPLMKIGFDLVGRKYMKSYDFEEGYFLPYAREFRAALDMPLMTVGGINKLATIQTALDDGFEFVAMARALVREPDLVNKFKAGIEDEGACIHCNRCIYTMGPPHGTSCVLGPREGDLSKT